MKIAKFDPWGINAREKALREKREATLVGEHKDPMEDPEHLKKLLNRFGKLKSYLDPRQTRMRELIARKSAQKWPIEKKAKMFRRFMEAGKELEGVTNAIDQCTTRLERLALPKS